MLADGGTVHIRPVRPDDDARILGLYEALSAESRYRRFFTPVAAPTARDLERLAAVDHHDHVLLAASLGDEFVAVARYDRTRDPELAEVAFSVRDDQHGRGLGTLLLEHLAAVARVNGIRRFTASTLPDNRRMLGVFRDAGFDVERRFAHGAIELEFPIAPTEAVLAAFEERERVSESRSVGRLLAPRSIAVVGASDRPDTLGHEVFRHLVEQGFTGALHPVNERGAAVAGIPGARSLPAIPGPVELVIVAVPAPAVPGVVADAARKGAHGVVVITGGFAEAGEAGRRAQAELVATVRRHGMRLVGPNCMGVVNTDPGVRMHATFAPHAPAPGRTALLSQSGTLGIELLARAKRSGLGISSFVSVGNKADVSGNDLLQYWDEDPRTEVILLYLESFGNPRKFARIARRVARRTPIVVVKSGRTRSGARAARVRTIAPADLTVDALFDQAGVLRVDTLDELFDTAMVLAHQPLPAGRRVGIVGNAGGPAVLAADACEAAGLVVPRLGTAVRSGPGGRARTTDNPVDLPWNAGAADYERCLRAVLADPSIDAVLVHHAPAIARDPDAVAAAVVRAASTTSKPVVACFLGRDARPDVLLAGDGTYGVPSFPFPDSAARALGRVARRAAWLRRPAGTLTEFAGLQIDAARALVADALAASGGAGGWLTAPAAVDLCAHFGIDASPTRLAPSARAAVVAADEIGYPVVVKATGPGIAHRTDAGAVRLDLAGPEAVRAAWTDLAARSGPRDTPLVVQQQAPAGIATVVGLGHDEWFGPLVLFGMGGPAAELLADGAVRILPVTDRDAADMVRAPRAAPLLFGYRGAPPVAVEALEVLIQRVGRLADELPEVAELTADPVLVSTTRAVAVDVRVRLATPAAAGPVGLRRLSGP